MDAVAAASGRNGNPPDQWPHLSALLESLAEGGEQPALLAFGQEGAQQFGRQQLVQQARRLAGGLRARGLAAGDRVALIAENSPELIAACLGIMGSGCVAVPLDLQMEQKTLAGVLEDSGAKLLLTTARHAERLRRVAPENIQEIFLLQSPEASERSGGSKDGGSKDGGSEDGGSEDGGSAEPGRSEAAGAAGRRGEQRNESRHASGAEAEEGGSGGQPRSWQALWAEEGETEEASQLAEEKDADALAVLFYTSGTTGPPKGVPLTHGNLITQLRTVSGAGLTQPDDRVLLPLPLHHVYPFVIGMLVPLSLRLPIILPRSLTGPDILQALREGEATTIVGVPRLYSALYEAIQSQAANAAGRWGRGAMAGSVGLSTWLRKYLRLPLGRAAFRPLHRRFAPHLRVLASGGSPLDPQLAWRLEGLGWQVAIGYGLTETSPLLTMHPPGAGHLDTVGKPIPDVQLRIDTQWQNEDGREAAAEDGENAKGEAGKSQDGAAASGDGSRDGGRKGEIVARGPSVFSGYWNLPEKTQEAFTDDGWFRTGDLGYLDRHGRLHVTGRVSTLLITEQGEKVQPDEVESAYAEAPEIREIGVLNRDGQLVALAVPETRQANSDQDLEKQVRTAIDRVGRQLPSYHRLTDVVITRKSLPRTRIGKIRRHELEERFEQAKQGEGPQPGPMPRDEMTPEDRELLDDPAAGRVWDLLAEQFKEQPLTPDASLQADLGVDSMQWLNLTMDVMQKSGVELDDQTLARIDSVRDLLNEVRQAAGGGEAQQDLLERPEEALTPQQRKRLEPLGAVGSRVSRGGFGLNRQLVRWWLRLQVEGIEHLPQQGPFVIAANHVSRLDPAVLAASLDRRRLEQTHWAAWVGATRRNPLTRLGSRLAQAVPIDPQRGVISSLAFGAAVLRREQILVWFPEGQRSDSGELLPFKPGLGVLLQRYPVPVVPAYLRGTYESMPRGRRLPRSRRVRLRYGAPLDPEDLEREGEGDEPSARIVDALHRAIRQMAEQSASS